ncbi:hypothetical protein FF38_06898 [Lucilia cuprina]|uniref:Uncharacterized protein n=1 Tax=Lucilia cuprina TaxID=7375 RepID=A0A0L0BL15_LUCCU|nr:hypothetical protein FF38_06898 [Lucilia cuprina]
MVTATIRARPLPTAAPKTAELTMTISIEFTAQEELSRVKQAAGWFYTSFRCPVNRFKLRLFLASSSLNSISPWSSSPLPFDNNVALNIGCRRHLLHHLQQHHHLHRYLDFDHRHYLLHYLLRYHHHHCFLPPQHLHYYHPRHQHLALQHPDHHHLPPLISLHSLI